MINITQNVQDAIEWMTNELIASIKSSTQLQNVSNATYLRTLPLDYLENLIVLTQCELLWHEATVEDLARAFLGVSYHLVRVECSVTIH